jgi:hypothetical protein
VGDAVLLADDPGRRRKPNSMARQEILVEQILADSWCGSPLASSITASNDP